MPDLSDDDPLDAAAFRALGFRSFHGSRTDGWAWNDLPERLEGAASLVALLATGSGSWHMFAAPRRGVLLEAEAITTVGELLAVCAAMGVNLRRERGREPDRGRWGRGGSTRRRFRRG